MYTTLLGSSCWDHPAFNPVWYEVCPTGSAIRNQLTAVGWMFFQCTCCGPQLSGLKFHSIYRVFSPFNGWPCSPCLPRRLPFPPNRVFTLLLQLGGQPPSFFHAVACSCSPTVPAGHKVFPATRYCGEYPANLSIILPALLTKINLCVGLEIPILLAPLRR